MRFYGRYIIVPDSCASNGVFGLGEFNWISEICLCRYGNEHLKILTENLL